MGICRINSDKLCVEINTRGAELSSLKLAGSDHNWVWSAGNIWARRAPILFPIVGKLRGNSYSHENSQYSLPQHGFARDSEFKIDKIEVNRISLSLEESAGTLLHYPFKFRLEVEFEVVGSSLEASFKVLNSGADLMFFNFGWHPGFVAPWGSHENSMIKIRNVFGDRKYLRNGLIPTTSQFFKGTEIQLNQSIFEEDALVFADLVPGLIEWSFPGQQAKLFLDCGDAPHLGLWSKNLSKFLCIEPWWGLADFESGAENISDKISIQSLDSGEVWMGHCRVEVSA